MLKSKPYVVKKKILGNCKKESVLVHYRSYFYFQKRKQVKYIVFIGLFSILIFFFFVLVQKNSDVSSFKKNLVHEFAVLKIIKNMTI